MENALELGLKEKILELLKSNNNLTHKQIAEKINSTEEIVRTLIWRLRKEGKVKASGKIAGNKYIYSLVKEKSEDSDNNDKINNLIKENELLTSILKKMLPHFIEKEVNLTNTTEMEDKKIMEMIQQCQLI